MKITYETNFDKLNQRFNLLGCTDRRVAPGIRRTRFATAGSIQTRTRRSVSDLASGRWRRQGLPRRRRPPPPALSGAEAA